ncbi:protein-glutamate O-methyltransferase CheR [Alteriqipengyuania lutimaris]|uniref:Chemotaxis protein methyltransferase n=2 Tax=Alteriqipengyuania lutimaris TaxID=1538146 RepID=A0A395LNR5_9SPHN|nr:protein-glutamate O-methyltransferase CheR [Alteriqipengyuania lutimaris]RDS78365.1 protein-glutamate O-methyltransferase CheR [Alteriqipengyuania lutimaris]
MMPALSPVGQPPAFAPEEARLDQRDFAKVAAIVDREARIALPPTKATLVFSRLSRRLRERGMATFRDYLALVEKDAEERATMVEALTTNHTHFFRESHHFDHFREFVLGELHGRARAGEAVRLWSAGSSSGEEVYSLVMCMLGKSRSEARWALDANVRVLATDLSARVVATAARAVYSEATVKPIPEEYRRQWLRQEGADFAVVDDARRLVTARELNLFGEWPMRQQYDVIFCRNVMIYFDDAATSDLIARFARLLRPGGYLYIGHSERLIGPGAEVLTPCGQTIYRKEGSTR